MPVPQETKSILKPAALESTYNSSLFRVLLWEDALNQLLKNGSIFGFDFGKPFRSQNIEMLTWAGGEWSRDGWILTHNSYLEIIYRLGIVGLVFIGVVLFLFIARIMMVGLSQSSLACIIVSAPLLSWLVSAFFMPLLEMPYLAIPFWSFFGLGLAYAKNVNMFKRGVISK